MSVTEFSSNSSWYHQQLFCRQGAHCFSLHHRRHHILLLSWHKYHRSGDTDGPPKWHYRRSRLQLYSNPVASVLSGRTRRRRCPGLVPRWLFSLDRGCLRSAGDCYSEGGVSREWCRGEEDLRVRGGVGAGQRTARHDCLFSRTSSELSEW